MAVSPTQRTLAKCRDLGWRACIVEKWVSQANRRIDVFGFGDVLALDDKPGSLLIQACAGSSTSAREKKIVDECVGAACDWLTAGNRIEVWGWRKTGAHGKRKLWTLKRSEVALHDGRCIVQRLEEL